MSLLPTQQIREPFTFTANNRLSVWQRANKSRLQRRTKVNSGESLALTRIGRGQPRRQPLGWLADVASDSASGGSARLRLQPQEGR